MWEAKYKCQHFPEVDHRPWVAKNTSTGVRVWKNASVRVRDRCKPCSRRQGDSGKRTKCCVFRYPHQLPLVVQNLEVNALTPGKTMRRHILEMQIPSMLNKECNLNKDPHQPTMRSRMRALISLASHKKRDTIGGLNCQSQYAQD